MAISFSACFSLLSFSININSTKNLYFDDILKVFLTLIFLIKRFCNAICYCLQLYFSFYTLYPIFFDFV